MADTRDWCEPLDGPIRELESLVRAAGDYVQASEDLRPRVLETARSQCGRRFIWHLAAFLMLLVSFTIAGGSRLTQLGSHDDGGVNSSDWSVFSRAESKSVPGGGDVWGMVEAFTDLREQQAEVLSQ